MAGGLKSVLNRRDDALSRIGWDRLESLLADHYRHEGYTVEHVGTGGTGRRFDGGIDLKLRKDDAYILVQSKHWNAKQVPHNAVHELLGVMVNEGATGAILVTSGEFTRAAIEAAAKQGHVQLVDGDGLRQMLGPLPEPSSPPLQPSELLQSIVSQPGSQRSEHPHNVTGKERRLWLLVAFVCFVGFVLLIRGLLHRTAGTAGPSQAAVASTARLPEPAGESPRLMETEVAAAPSDTASDHASGDPCHEVIDAPSGTYIDHCAHVAPAPQPTKAEIRESRRKADEAMKTIEANTPEM